MPTWSLVETYEIGHVDKVEWHVSVEAPDSVPKTRDRAYEGLVKAEIMRRGAGSKWNLCPRVSMPLSGARGGSHEEKWSLGWSARRPPLQTNRSRIENLEQFVDRSMIDCARIISRHSLVGWGASAHTDRSIWADPGQWRVLRCRKRTTMASAATVVSCGSGIFHTPPDRICRVASLRNSAVSTELDLCWYEWYSPWVGSVHFAL